eukprot:888325-Pelagomonas_calceolata.AAC.6
MHPPLAAAPPFSCSSMRVITTDSTCHNGSNACATASMHTRSASAAEAAAAASSAVSACCCFCSEAFVGGWGAVEGVRVSEGLAVATGVAGRTAPAHDIEKTRTGIQH